MLAANTWDGYSGGDAPGLAFETLDWLHKKQVAAIATDTWGAEVRPNETDEANQPWHWISIPIMGLTVGEIFDLGGTREGVRGGQALRVSLRGAGIAGDGRGRFAGESAGDQVKERFNTEDTEGHREKSEENFLGKSHRVSLPFSVFSVPSVLKSFSHEMRIRL